MGIPEPPKDKLIDLTLSFYTNRTSGVGGQINLIVMINFTLLEKAAIFHIAMALIQADGKTDPREIVLLSTQTSELGIDDQAMSLSTSLSIDEVLGTIRKMSYAQKVFVTQFLTALVGIDGNMDEKEKQVLTVLAIKCNLPIESASAESLKYFFDKVFNII